MRIVALRLIAHHEQVAVAQIPAPTLAGRPMPQNEPSAISETDRRDGWSWTQLWLIVAVVAHRVSAVPIEIGQARVEVDAKLVAKAFPQFDQRLRPRGRIVHDAGVTVGAVTHPCSQSRCRPGAPVERYGVLLPGNLVPKRSEQLVSVGYPAAVVVDARSSGASSKAHTHGVNVRHAGRGVIDV